MAKPILQWPTDRRSNPASKQGCFYILLIPSSLTRSCHGENKDEDDDEDEDKAEVEDPTARKALEVGVPPVPPPFARAPTATGLKEGSK